MQHRLESALLMGAFPPGELLPPERELAKRYGVTRKTISRALAKMTRSGLLISRPRIGYTINAVTRNNRSVAVHAIGLIWAGMPPTASTTRFTFAIERQVASAGHVLMMGASRSDTEHEDDAIHRLCAAGMDALIIAPAQHGAKSRELEKWIAAGRPLVLHGQASRCVLPAHLVKQCDLVDVDNQQGIRKAVELLISLGHRAFGFVSAQSFTGSERHAGFCACIDLHGLRTDPAWQVPNMPVTPEGANAALARMQAAGELPTAVVCSHDSVAQAFVHAVRARGLRCPEDLSVTGFGNWSLGGTEQSMDLTTVDEMAQEQTDAMLRLLTRQMAGERTHPEQIRIPPQLVVRGSTGPARGSARQEQKKEET
jgi:LacI family transcriptional regulator